MSRLGKLVLFAVVLAVAWLWWKSQNSAAPTAPTSGGEKTAGNGYVDPITGAKSDAVFGATGAGVPGQNGTVTQGIWAPVASDIPALAPGANPWNGQADISAKDLVLIAQGKKEIPKTGWTIEQINAQAQRYYRYFLGLVSTLPDATAFAKAHAEDDEYLAGLLPTARQNKIL